MFTHIIYFIYAFICYFIVATLIDVYFFELFLYIILCLTFIYFSIYKFNYFFSAVCSFFH